MGQRAVLLEDLELDPATWSAAFRANPQPGVVDVVPAAKTVLVTFSSAEARRGASFAVVQAAAAANVRQVLVEIPVTYDGADLEEVAQRTGLTTAQVVDRHAGAVYHVAFCGFAPGFAYLRGLPEGLHLPRRTTPRTSVPAGSVAIAAEYSAVYPRSSPGGWHLLGTTEIVLFDPHRSEPALLQPGARVRFVPT
jgi:KipI family sensor histidine kinase inhibitor